MSAPHKHSFTPFYTPKTRFLLSAVRKCHVFLGNKKHQERQPSHFNVSTYINAVYFLFYFFIFFCCFNWAAKVHEPLANLAAHECRVSFLRARGILGVQCAAGLGFVLSNVATGEISMGGAPGAIWIVLKIP